jgi:hypothetical protein
VRLNSSSKWALKQALSIAAAFSLATLPQFAAAAESHSSATAQNVQTMLPEENVAKAKEILNQVVDALGGPSYLEAHQRQCDGRRAQFGHNGELTGFIEFKDYWQYPDKHRVDYSKKRNIIDLFDGDEGWTMDRSGVSPEPPGAVTDFQILVNQGVDHVLRYGIKDPNIVLNYAGRDTVDMRQVDWIEVTFPDRTLRLAVDRSSHLLLHSTINSINEVSQERQLETTIYTNYQRKDGIMVALQISRERDGKRFYQAFYDTCTYNPNLPPDTFTKAALEKRYAEVGSKKDRDKYKNARE